MKRRTLIALICLLAAILPAALIAVGLSRRGVLPSSLEDYSETVTVRDPDGHEFTYERKNADHAAILSAIGTATATSKSDAESSAERYDRFDLMLDGSRSLSLSLYVSVDDWCAFVSTASEKYYRLSDDAIGELLKSDFAACLWVGDAPPRASLGSVELKTAVVEWSRLLPDGTRVSSGEYVSRTPTEYSVSTSADIAPDFARKPSSTLIVVYDSDRKRYFEGTSDELPYITLPIDRALSVMYSAEWENADGSCVRAAYSFAIPAKD